jgi:hypothetical protein
MSIFYIPVLTYVEYAPLRHSKITIFAHTCRFLIQALRGGYRIHLARHFDVQLGDTIFAVGR